MNRAGRWFVVAGVAVGLVALAGRELTRAQEAAVPYPTGYREWLHVKSMVIHEPRHPLYDAFGGIHHVYVNHVGAAAARTGGSFPEGSVLVFDLLEARAEGGALVEGARKVLAVMRKDRRRAETGGWAFEAFKEGRPEARLVTDARAQCFGCHQGQQSTDYVFSRVRP
jgi:hypothetical protein